MKPQDFAIGIRDFFAILVPGAIVLFLLPALATTLRGADWDALDIIALAIAAYLIGSIADKVGAVLDRPIDNFLKSDRISLFSSRLAARRAEAEACQRELLESCDPEIPVREPASSTRAFWWDQLRLDCPAAMQELDRIEAAQKLFRSLTAAFVFLAFYAKGAALLGAQSFVYPHPHAARWLLFAGFVSAALYLAGRFSFFAAVCRLAVAYTVHRRSPPPKAKT